MSDSSSRDDQLRSALERLPLAVVVVENARNVRPYNAKGTEFFEREALSWDILQTRPSHPLALFIRAVLESKEPVVTSEALLEMPSGAAYHVEVSRRSEKGPSRLLVLIVQPRSTQSAAKSLERWGFTNRELDVVRQLLTGASSAEICERMSISSQTLKSHVSRILEKAEARSRAELVAKLLKEA